MPDARRTVYWDSCVFLDYINGIPEKLPILDSLIDRAGPRGDIEIVTSTLSIAEVAFGRLDQSGTNLDPSIEAKIDALWTDSIVKQVEFHKGIAFEARDLIRAARIAGAGLQAADAIHLATARRIGAAEFQTYDSKLFRHSGLVGFAVQEPTTNQARLTGL